MATDPDLDNQPVELFETPVVPKTEEDERIVNSWDFRLT